MVLQLTVPEIFGISPSIACKSDDFPAPTGPQIAILCPRCTVKFTSLRVRMADSGSQLNLPAFILTL